MSTDAMQAVPATGTANGSAEPGRLFYHSKDLSFWQKLLDPFSENEIEFKDVWSKGQKTGKKIAYISSRALMNRLDMIAGPERWWETEPVVTASGICVGLYITTPSGIVVGPRWGCSEWTEIAPMRGGETTAFRRACVKFGMGRYLYEDGIPNLETGELTYPEIPAGPPAGPPAYMQPPQGQPAFQGQPQYQQPYPQPQTQPYAPPPYQQAAAPQAPQYQQGHPQQQ